MDVTFKQVMLRRLAMLLLVIGFCLLPGPRTLLTSLFGFFLEPNSIKSFEAGLHLSVIHFCWLFGLEMPSWEYPEYVDSQLAALALILSLAVQVTVLLILIFAWRSLMHWYYLRRELIEERAEFGDFEA